MMSDTGTPADGGGRPALSRLLTNEHGPADLTGFADRDWGRRPRLVRAADPNRFADLFGPEAVDELIATRGLRAPFARVAREGRTLPDRDFTGGGGVGATVGDQLHDDKLLRLFADGSTIVLQGLHRTWAPIIDFSQELAADLGHPVQVNAYITPDQNQGFSDHYDVHDVFVLQITGEKRWRVREPVLEAPLREQSWDHRRAAVEAAAQQPPPLEETLRPGDCLYLPRGFIHAATALGESIHLTVGVHVWTVRHLIDQVVEQARQILDDTLDARASLPLGVDPCDLADGQLELARELLQAAVAGVTEPSVAAGLAGPVRSAGRPEAIGPLRQLTDAQQVTGGDRVRLRRHLAARLDTSGQTPMLVSRAGRLELTAPQAAAVSGLLTTTACAVDDLGIDLARRLLVAGVAIRV